MGAEGVEVLSEVKFVIPSLPPSVNQIYNILIAQRRVEMKPEVRLWKSRAKEIVPRFPAHEDVAYFGLHATFHYDFFYKNGKVKKFDSQNLLKVLCDAVSEKVGFDDSLIKCGSWMSKHSVDKEMVEVVLKQLGEGVA